MHISFLSLVVGHFLDLLFNHGTQRLEIHDLLALNTLVNTFPNRGADHLLIVRRLEVVNEPFDHLILHHGGVAFV